MNTINAPIGARKKIKTNPLYQYDYGQKLILKGVQLPDSYEVLFGNEDTELKTVLGDANGVNIPDEFLQTGKIIKAYVFLHTGLDDGETEYEITIPVNPRPNAINEPITPVEQSIIEQAIAVLNVAIDTTTEYMQTTKAYRDETEVFRNEASVSAYNSSVSEENAQSYKNQALDYAQQAESSESNAKFYKESAETSATEAYESKEAVEQMKEDVESEVDAFDAKVITAKSEIESLGNSKLSAITNEGITQKNNVTAEGTTQINAITSLATEKLTAITTEGNTQTQRVTNEGQTQTDAIQTEGEEQIQAIEDKGQEVISLIPYMAPVIVDTASGDIATFPDGADDYPLKSLKVSLEPIQDLNGQEYPYPSGGQLWDEEWELGRYVNGVKDPISTQIRCKNRIEVSASTKYYFKNGSGEATIQFLDENGTFISTAYRNNAEFTTPSNAKYLVFTMNAVYGTTYKNDISINYPSTDTSYHPYSNICPISGWDEVEVEQRGKNLFDKSDSSLILYDLYINNGVIAQGGQRKIIAMPCKPNTTYTASKTRFESNTRWGIGYTKGAPQYGTPAFDYVSAPTNGTVGQTASATTTTGAEAKYIVIWASWTSSIWSQELDTIQIELGTTATAYEPYQGNTYPISLPSTVYGGEVSVADGDGKSAKRMLDLGSINWRLSSNTEYFVHDISDALFPPDIYTAPTNALCSNYKPASAINLVYNTDGQYDKTFSLSPSARTLIVRDSTYGTDVEAFKTAMNGVQLCYELATPTDFTTTPTEIKSLKATNNIWSDGEVSVEYCADTKLYIDKKLG